MLRRTGDIFLIVVLLFGTTGLTINRHYCGTNLVRTSLFYSHGNCCKANCPYCHNEKISFRISDKFESSPSKTNFAADFKILLNQHSLPTLLAFSTTLIPVTMDDQRGGPLIKPSHLLPVIAGKSSVLLQVFLF